MSADESKTVPGSALGLRREDWGAVLAEAGEKPFRAKQIWDWLHAKRVAGWDDCSNLSKPLRDNLSKNFSPRLLQESAHQSSADALTEKWLFACVGADAQSTDAIETVLIREQHLTRRTVCVSSMVGCPLECAFCATGQCGFVRNLSAGEMVEQVYRVDAACRESENLTTRRAVSHVVFMGMGEPLLNLDATLAAADLLADADGLNLSARHITFSTVGIPSGIRRLAEAGPQYRLAWSLHAPNQALREEWMPAAKRWPLPEILAALREWSEVGSRGLTVEYCLVHRRNDRKSQAVEVAQLLRELPCKVNLIPLNPTQGFDAEPPPPDRVRAFRDTLEANGVPATIRVEKGREIGAACGQLRRDVR